MRTPKQKAATLRMLAARNKNLSGAVKPAAKHIDKNSHNVNVKVVSGNKKRFLDESHLGLKHNKLDRHAIRLLTFIAKFRYDLSKKYYDTGNLKSKNKIDIAYNVIREIIKDNGYTLSENGKLIKELL